MKNVKKVNNKKKTTSKKAKVQKAIIAPIVVTGLLVNSVSPTLALASPLLVEVQKSEVVVVYKNDSGKQKVLDKAIEVKDDLGTLKAINVVLTESAIRSLERDPDIGYVERKIKHDVELLGTPGQWNVEAVNAPKAWEQGITGQGVKVAIIDSGVANHSELPNVVQRLSFIQDDPNTATNEGSIYDNNGHGTHVAGIVGAKIGGPTSGGKEFVGVAPNVSLYSLKVVDGEQGTVMDVIEAIDWAIANGMDVINLSLGLDSHVQLLQDAVDRAYQAGIVVVGASGNDGNGTPVNYPAKYDSVIAVSSVDQGKTLSSFSSTGAEVEFSAPGGAVLSTYASGGTATYASVGGTSQASPHVAGFVALLMQKDPSKSASEIRVELQKYVDDLGEEGRDELYGYGFIDYLAFDETAPAEVTTLEATEKTQDSITVSWTNPVDVDFAKTVIEVNGEVVGETTDKTQNTFKIEELNPATEYTIVVKTVDAKENTSVGEMLVVSTEADVTAPAEVTDLAVSDVTINSANISYTLPTDEDFEIANIYVNGELFGQTAGNTYAIEDLTSSTDYTVIVKTVDVNGNESVGEEVTFTTVSEEDVTAPAEVTNLVASDVTENSFMLTWNNPTDEDFLLATIYQDGEQIASSEDGTFLFEMMEANTEYEIVVKTMDFNGNESEGETIVVKTAQKSDLTAPDEVTGLTATEVTHESIKLSFTNPTNEDFSRTQIFVNGEFAGDTDTNEFVLTELDPETEYEIVVNTIDTSLNESVGQTIRVTTTKIPDTTAPAEVTGLTVDEKSHDFITVSYVNPSDEDFAKANVYLNGELVGESTTGTYTFEDLNPETAYDIEITAVDETGNESEGVTTRVYTEQAPDVSAPAEVTGIQIIDSLINSIKIGWTNPSDEDFKGVNVYLDGVFQGFVSKLEESVFTFVGLVAGTDYVIETRTVDETGNESDGVTTNASTQTPDTTAPAEVTELKATNVSADRIEISFANPSDEDFAKANIYVDGELVGETTSNSYAIEELNSETQYEITVKTVDTEGNESVGEVITVKTPDVTAPNEVTELQVSNVTGTSALVTFNNPSNEDFATAKVFVNDELVGETTEGSYELTNLDSETSYSVKVVTVDESGNESNGQTVTVQTLDVTAPNEVTALEVTESTTDSIAVSFTKPSDEDFAKTNFYLNGDLVGSTTSETFTFEGLTAETEYSIIAKTVDAQGNESEGVALTTATKEIPDTIAPSEVTGLEVTSVNHNSMTIGFENPSDEDFAKANVYVNGQLVGETTSGTYELADLSAETAYEITVKTVDELGNESVGQTINVTTKEVPDTFAPAEVTELEATNVTTESATISWTNPSDEDFSKAIIFVNGEEKGEATSGTYELSGLTAETSYEVVVKTIDEKGNVSVGATLTLTTEAEPVVEEPTPTEPPTEPVDPEPTPEPTPEPIDEIAPGEVTDAQAKDITTTSAVISWTNPTDEDFAKTNIYVNDELVDSLEKGEESTFSMDGLTSETSYTVVIKTVDEAGNESVGQTVTFSTEAVPVVVEPTEPTEPPTEPVEPPTEPVEPPTDPTDPVEPPTEPVEPPTEPVDPEPTPEPIDETAPANASDVQATDVTQSSATISWTSPSDADFAKTNIYVNGELVKTIAKGEATTFILENLDAETDYAVEVKTVDEKGNESEGIELNITTLAEVVEEPTPTEPPTEPVNPPTEPVEPPTEPVEPPTEPVEPPTEPVNPPTEPVEPPTEPVEPPTEPVNPPTEPVEPSEPTPTEPTEPEEPSEPTPTEPEQPVDPEPTPTPSEPTEDEVEKGFFETLKDAVLDVLSTIADFFTPDKKGEKKELDLEDFGLAYEFKNQLTAEQQAKVAQYKNEIKIQEITSEGFRDLNKVGANQNIKLTLKNAIDPTSLNGEDVFIRHNGAIVNDFKMVVGEDGKTVTFKTPSGEDFEPGKYALFIDNKGLKSIDGNAVENPVVVVFNLK